MNYFADGNKVVSGYFLSARMFYKEKIWKLDYVCAEGKRTSFLCGACIERQI